MTLMTKEDLILATKQRRLHVVKNFYSDFPSWEDIDHFYDLAKITNTIVYNSFGTMIVEDDMRVLRYYQKAISNFSSCYKGHVLFSMMIIHFINRNNNAMKIFLKFCYFLLFAILLSCGSGASKKEKTTEKEEKEDVRYTSREFSYQSFTRTFNLQKDVMDTEKIMAKGFR